MTILAAIPCSSIQIFIKTYCSIKANGIKAFAVYPFSVLGTTAEEKCRRNTKSSFEKLISCRHQKVRVIKWSTPDDRKILTKRQTKLLMMMMTMMMCLRTASCLYSMMTKMVWKTFRDTTRRELLLQYYLCTWVVCVTHITGSADVQLGWKTLLYLPVKWERLYERLQRDGCETQRSRGACVETKAL